MSYSDVNVYPIEEITCGCKIEHTEIIAEHRLET